MKILVPEAHAMGSIACIRSLGRAGHETFGVAQRPDALGLQSRFCHHPIVLPAGLRAGAYRERIRSLVQEYRIDLVLPSEGLVVALGDEVATLADHLPCGPDPARLQRFVGKYELFQHFLEAKDDSLRLNMPRTSLLLGEETLDLDLAGLEGPLFAKFDAHARADLPARVVSLTSPATAREQLPALLRAYGRGLVQQSVPGQGVGVFFLRWNGRILATLMHRRLHEVPHTGGVSSLRETWWDDELHADALRRIESLDWWGVGMLEYRYEGAGRFHLMEFNARFWGSLHLALYAGVDFPALLARAWSGENIEPVRAAAGVRCRWTFPKELEHLWSLVRDPQVAWSRKLSSLAGAALTSLDPRVRSDLWFPGDRGLWWEALRRTPGHFLRRA